MTIFDAKSLLFTFFSKNDVYDPLKNFKELIPISENEELDKDILKSALGDMTEAKLVKLLLSYDESNRTFSSVWVLTQPLERYDQNITLSYITTNAIFELLKESSVFYKNPAMIPEPLNIKEVDIQNLIILVNTALKK